MRIYAFKLPGLEPLGTQVPLAGVVESRAISSPAALEGSMSRAAAEEPVLVESTGETVPMMRDHGTLLITVTGSKARAYIVDMATRPPGDPTKLTFSAFGFASIIQGQPWLDEDLSKVRIDPMDVLRTIWQTVTADPARPEVAVEANSSSVRLGTESEDVEFTTGEGEHVSFEAGPYKLNWWSTDDLGGEVDDLAAETPFEWVEETSFDLDSDAAPRLAIRAQHPRLPSPRRDSLKFTIDTNVFDPRTDESAEWFSDVLVLGAGEGSEKVRGKASRRDHGRMRRTKTLSDSGITSDRRADVRAEEEIRRSEEKARTIVSCRVTTSDAARPGSYDLGDIITITGRMPWGRVDQDARIVELSHDHTDDSVTLTLEHTR